MRQLSTFRIGPHQLGIDVALVQEVVRLRAITRVPLAHPRVAGLVNLRGDVLTAIDVRARLAPAEAQRDGEADQLNVVVRVHEEVFSLLVDELGGVVDVSDWTHAPAPATLEPQLRPLITGVCVRADQPLLLVLDPGQLLGPEAEQ